MGAVNVLVGITLMFLVERAGRKLLLLVSCLGCAISMSGLGTFFYLKHVGEDVSQLNWLPLTAMVISNIFFGIGLGT